MLALWTASADGDQRDIGSGSDRPGEVPAERHVRRLRQVHGARAVVVDDVPGDGRSVDFVPEGDALVSAGSRSALAVLTADCAPVALGSPEGVHAAVHVGWRGLVAGVIDEALAVMRSLGASDIVAGLGPCIGPCCYEFSPSLAASLSRHQGIPGTALTTEGRPSFDVPGSVRARLAAAGVPLVVSLDSCTACTPGYFSHRARRDEARQAMLVWRTG